jgi:hypothetical protein
VQHWQQRWRAWACVYATCVQEELAGEWCNQVLHSSLYIARTTEREAQSHRSARRFSVIATQHPTIGASSSCYLLRHITIIHHNVPRLKPVTQPLTQTLGCSNTGPFTARV